MLKTQVPRLEMAGVGVPILCCSVFEHAWHVNTCKEGKTLVKNSCLYRLPCRWESLNRETNGLVPRMGYCGDCHAMTLGIVG